MAEQITRNLGMELVRATEAAAMAAARWMGRGDKNAADGAAVNAMRYALGNVDMHGVVVIGEGEKDEAPMLFIGEVIGNGQAPDVDIAVDPIDGTRLTALGLPGAIAVVAAAPRGTFYGAPPGIYYMEKIAVGPDLVGTIDITRPIKENIRSAARRRGCDPSDITVMILDRPRHDHMVKEIRESGARIKLIGDGDVAGAIAAATPGSPVDMLIGIGGAPEAVIAAAAIRCIGGDMQCRLYPRNEKERWEVESIGVDLTEVLMLNDLAQSDDVYFAATGITDGDLLGGVHYYPNGATTHSIVMRGKTGTTRRMEAHHRLKKLERYTSLADAEPVQPQLSHI
ncbi:MAG TPA: class II fructose-bisphosphatase [Chloroflexia bacterium]|nr:class II fructose-bisphosphatase [Chloroflexia bacterium]